MDPDVPLIVPEVNADAVAGFRKKNIIANPNCSTAQLVVALKPLHDKAKIKRVVVATYQSVSGAGKDGDGRAVRQTKAVFTLGEIETKKFPKRIAFNVIPHIDVFMEDGYTKEEWKMMVETKKILDPKIKLTATCVRVPVFIGHSEAVNIEFEKPITADEAREILRNAPGCLVIDKREPGGYVTPYECAGEDATYISRIREDPTVDNGLVLWVRVRQPAQGRGAQRHPDRRSADQPQADPGEAEGGVDSVPHAKSGRAHGRAATSRELAGRLVEHRQIARSRRRNRRRAVCTSPRSTRLRSRGNVIRLSRLSDDVGLFQCVEIVRGRHRAARPDLRGGRRDQRHPAADEIARRSGSASSAKALTPPQWA